MVAFYGSIGVPLFASFRSYDLAVYCASICTRFGSIMSTVSAVSYFHKVNGFPDPSNAFLVTKLLAGARNVGAVPDVRLPVTLHILSRLVVAMPTVFSSHYKCLMLRAMMVLAFKAYLRVGEMVPRSRCMVRGCLSLGDVLLSGDLITISFQRFKAKRASKIILLTRFGYRYCRTR